MSATHTPEQAPSRKAVIAWSLWDWGSAAFNAVIITFVFTVYLTDSVGKDVPGPFSAATLLAWSIGAASLLVAILAPAMGQRFDAAGRRRRALAWLTASVVAVTALMFLVQEHYSYLWLGLVLVAIGTVLFELAQVPYSAMLRQISTPETVGRVSGIGWAFGYLGGIVLLLIVYFGLIVDDGGMLGVSGENGLNIRIVALVAAAWFLVFSIPVLRAVPEVDENDVDIPKVGFVESYRLLARELRQMWDQDRRTVWFLLASALYRDGLSGVFTFGAILAVNVYGFTDETVIPFAIVANVAAAAGAFAAGRIDDRMGPKPVIVGSLGAMIVAGCVLLAIDGSAGFWVFGLALCLFVGPAQSASRTFLLRLTKTGREGQNFGLYAMTGRAASFLTPVLFGVFAFALGDDRWGIIGIMLVLGAGLVALLFIRPPAKDDVLHT